MNEMERQNLARKNIIALRNHYGESKTDLAIALGYNGPNAIWNLESGEQRIPEDVMARIEAHYMIPMGSLSTEDFADLLAIKLPTQKKQIRDLALTLTPIVTSKSAENDLLFNEAYKLHTDLLNSVFTNNNSELHEDEIFDKYAESYENNGTIESLINLVSILINNASGQNNEWLVEYADNCFALGYYGSGEGLSKKERRKLFEPLLKRTTSDQSTSDEETGDHSIDDIIVYFLRIIKENDYYTDIAYFYMAMRYYMNTVKNGKSFPDNQQFGRQMLQCLYLLGNSYAETFFKEHIALMSE